ncbi:hypothetical protein OH77DRAFT_979570 [Trametes cingulata]|nr:hypothetical protein OH77DRAFT_979570 [Trametes cingulata]
MFDPEKLAAARKRASGGIWNGCSSGQKSAVKNIVSRCRRCRRCSYACSSYGVLAQDAVATSDSSLVSWSGFLGSEGYRGVAGPFVATLRLVLPPVTPPVNTPGLADLRSPSPPAILSRYCPCPSELCHGCLGAPLSPPSSCPQAFFVHVLEPRTTSVSDRSTRSGYDRPLSVSRSLCCRWSIPASGVQRPIGRGYDCKGRHARLDSLPPTLYYHPDARSFGCSA